MHNANENRWTLLIAIENGSVESRDIALSLHPSLAECLAEISLLEQGLAGIGYRLWLTKIFDEAGQEYSPPNGSEN